jgi:hypothetical protein
MKCVDDITPQMGVSQKTADTNTHVKNVGSEDMAKVLAVSKKDASFLLHPKYLRYNWWRDDEEFSKSSADWTHTVLPLPSPPPIELSNPVVSKTIRENPHLFKIVPPINVDKFEALLSKHPNQPFVKSVCRGLREGFWPWADTHISLRLIRNSSM